jgi:hypothetical protein
MKRLVQVDRGLLSVGLVSAAWLVSYFAARWLLEHAAMAPWLRVAVALFPVPFFALFLVLFIRGIRGLDELQRRIQLEALAVAFPLAVLLLMTLGLLQRAIELPFEDWSYAHVWVYLPLFYFFGICIAARRYR